MGLFDLLFKSRPKPAGKYAGVFKLLNGYEPHFTTRGGSIYEAELVRAAINAIATQISKLKIETRGSAKPALQRKLRHGPNEIQTWSTFMYRLATIWLVYNNAFLVPEYDQYGEISGIFCALPDRCEVVQFDVGSGKKVPYLRYKFGSGETAAIELAYCAILPRFQFRNDLFGESNDALNPTLDLIHIQNEGIREGVKSAANYRFFGTMLNFDDDEDIANERRRFWNLNFSREAKNKSGLLIFPNTITNVKQIEAKPYVVDAEQMRLIEDGVYSYFGVNKKILQSEAYGDAWSAFYESCIENFAIMFSEACTKMLFSMRERTEGNLVMASANRLQYLTTKEKLEYSVAMLDRGLANRDEIREIWNQPQLPNGEGQAFIIRGEYVNAAERVTSGTDKEEGDDNNDGSETE